MFLGQNHADPYIRNSRQESPLDLAAQYGRMETVSELFLLLSVAKNALLILVSIKIFDQSQIESNRACLILMLCLFTPLLACTNCGMSLVLVSIRDKYCRCT